MRMENIKGALMYKNLVILIILFLGFILRLFKFFYLSTIQQDSPQYLYQAMVLATGNLNLLELCSISSKITEINLFSIVIVPFYYLFKNWEIAGKVVSLISSSLSLALLYIILRNFLEKHILYLVLLIYSFNPILIQESAEILRESFFTFLVLLGVWFFIKGYYSDQRWKFFFFLLANLSWILSSWVRVEGITLIILTFLYLLSVFLFSKDRKTSLISLLSFSIIPFILLLAIIAYLSFYKGFFLTEIKVKLTLLNPFEQPFAKELKNFRYLDIPMPSPYFWDMLKQNLWLVAFGTTFFYKFIPTLHFSNFIFFLAGFKNLKSFIKDKPLVSYFLFLSFSYFLVLWYFTFTKWYMEKRYMLHLLFFISPIIALGIENIKSFVQQRFNLSPNKIFIFLIIYIVVFSCIKIFKEYRPGDIWIKQVAIDVAKFISDDQAKLCSITACKNLVFTREARVFFYVSKYKNVILCPAIEDRIFYIKLREKSTEEIVNYIASKGYKFAVLEKEIFKEKVFILRQRLEALGIRVYVVS